MGMFDNLKVEAPLPVPSMQDRTFQTKSLDRELADYVITAAGELRCVGGAFEPEHRTVPLHGDLTFYDWEHKRPDDVSDWDYGELVYFVARFTEGKLVRIWLVEAPGNNHEGHPR
jgi:hypothetical protein